MPVRIVPDAVPSGGANCNLSVQDAFAFTILPEHLSRIVVKDESPLSTSVPIVTGTVVWFLIVTVAVLIVPALVTRNFTKTGGVRVTASPVPVSVTCADSVSVADDAPYGTASDPLRAPGVAGE